MIEHGELPHSTRKAGDFFRLVADVIGHIPFSWIPPCPGSAGW
jgi:hypothetical protein